MNPKEMPNNVLFNSHVQVKETLVEVVALIKEAKDKRVAKETNESKTNE